MNIEFIKDHVSHKKGDVVSNHPNEYYLIILGVAKEVKPKKKKKDEE